MSRPAARPVVRRAGLIGAVVGVAAAGIAAGVAAERALIRRSRGVADPYADEEFGRQPYDKSLTVPTAEGTALHVEIVEPRVAGDPAPTVVFVHGFCLDMGTFYFQRRFLAERGERRLVCYDQPGHGRSGELEDGEYDLASLGEGLRAVLDATAPAEPIVLVGHSMGGMTIMAFAEKYPEWFGARVVGVVLIATSGGEVQGARMGLATLAARASAPLLPLVNGVARVSGGVIDRARAVSSDLAWLLTRRYGFGSANPSPALVSFVERMNSTTSAETVARYLRTLYAHARYPALAAMRRTPVLVIVGDKDMITPVEHSREIVRYLPDAELLTVRDSGHVVMLEHADEVNRALDAFLEKIA